MSTKPKQPENPGKVIDWLALQLIEKKAKDKMTPDEIQLIAQSQLLAELLPFYRGLETLNSYVIDPKAQEAEKELTVVSANFQLQIDDAHMPVFRAMWAKRGAEEWEWRKLVSKDGQALIDKYLGLEEVTGFLGLCYEINKLDDESLLDSLFLAMQKLPETFKWENLNGKYQEVLAERFENFLQTVKQSEKKVKEQWEADAKGKNRGREDSPLEEGRSTASNLKKQEQT